MSEDIDDLDDDLDEDEPINDPQEVLPEENPSPSNSRQSLNEVKKHGK
jgi:hypothetical protein